MLCYFLQTSQRQLDIATNTGEGCFQLMAGHTQENVKTTISFLQGQFICMCLRPYLEQACPIEHQSSHCSNRLYQRDLFLVIPSPARPVYTKSSNQLAIEEHRHQQHVLHPERRPVLKWLFGQITDHHLIIDHSIDR